MAQCEGPDEFWRSKDKKRVSFHFYTSWYKSLSVRVAFGGNCLSSSALFGDFLPWCLVYKTSLFELLIIYIIPALYKMLFCKNWKVAHHKQRADYQRPTDRLSLANQTNHLGAAERELKKNISPSSCPFENTLFNSQILEKYNYFFESFNVRLAWSFPHPLPFRVINQNGNIH